MVSSTSGVGESFVCFTGLTLYFLTELIGNKFWFGMGVGEEKQNLEAQALGENVYWLVGTVDNNNNNNNNNNCLLF